MTSHRDTLLMGGRVLELGCGAGLPSMVCALLGARVVATDLPRALGPIRRNAAATGYPQEIWKVVAGKAAGGIVVQKGRGIAQEKEPERLSFGALVEQLQLDGDFIRFRRLLGSGPEGGWTRVRQPWGQTQLAETEERPPVEDPSWGSLYSLPFEWDAGAAQELLAEGDVDLLLCSDCVCEALYGRSWEALVECLEVLCSPRTAALVSVQRRREDGFEAFLARLGQNLHVARISATLWAGKEVLLFEVRRRSRSETFHADLNENMPQHAPPGSPLKVVRNLKGRARR